MTAFVVVSMLWILVLILFTQCLEVNRFETESKDSTRVTPEFYGTSKGEILEQFARQDVRWLSPDVIWSGTEMSPMEFSEALNELLNLELIQYSHESGYYRAEDSILMAYQRYLGISEDFDHYMLLVDDPDSIRTEQHKHRTMRGELVRSQEEVIVADTLNELGIPYEYERPLHHPRIREMILPDFTIDWNEKTFYWEHLGMSEDAQYRERWEARKRWYYEAGFGHQLITSTSGPDGRVDPAEIRRIARERILVE